jgi:hypothetical protein
MNYVEINLVDPQNHVCSFTLYSHTSYAAGRDPERVFWCSHPGCPNSSYESDRDE